MMNEDKFKAMFKYYKSKDPKPSLHEVITADSDRVTQINLEHLEDNKHSSLFGLKSTEWTSYTLEDHPGLILIRNPFTAAGQRYWIKRCLENYPRKPNKTNIDHEMELSDWWNECHRDGHCNKVLLKKLRWTTLGYHHNWDTKVYTEHNQSPFPKDLADLSAVVAERIGLDTFRAEAAIVNYYHMDSTLAPHTDHSECNLDAPLFSFSFGQSAIFLIGGQDKSIEPSAILLQSGDIIIMSKEARLCYHAVPKILPAVDKPWIEDLLEISNSNEINKVLKNGGNEIDSEKVKYGEESVKDVKHESIAYIDTEKTKIKENFVDDVYSDPSVDLINECSGYIKDQEHTSNTVRLKYWNSDGIKTIRNHGTDKDWHTFASYVEESRINMNVRQVLNDKQKCVPDL